MKRKSNKQIRTVMSISKSKDISAFARSISTNPKKTFINRFIDNSSVETPAVGMYRNFSK